MDEAVLRSMAKWPNVPHVYGWLQLDRRGTWLIKGERISNRSVTEFICRNYQADERGRWYFQNGPQRVFVRLEYTPFVVVTGAGEDLLEAHTGRPVDKVSGAWVDDAGSLLLRWGAGIGVMNDRDLAAQMAHFTDVRGNVIDDALLARAFDPQARRHATGVFFEHGGNRVPIGRIQAGEVPQKFGFDPDPRPAPGEPEC
jgi:hypothetical protein